jgi:hypothetical protein
MRMTNWIGAVVAAVLAVPACGGSGGTHGTGGAGGASSTSSGATSSSAASSGATTSGAGGAGGAGGAPGPTVLVALLDNTTPYDPADPKGQLQNDLLTVVDPAKPNLPLLGLSGLAESEAIGSFRTVATSKSKRRLGVIDLKTLRVFDENLQPLVNVTFSNGYAPAVCPTEQDIFALTSTVGTISTGTIVKFDSNGSYVGSTSGTHGVDLIVDEDHQVVWTVGKNLTRAKTDLSNEQQLHTFVWAAVSLDLDANGGIWAAERKHPQVAGSVDRLVHFDVNGIIIGGDTLPLAGSPMSVRVDRNSGLVWVAMYNAGVAYRDVNGQLNTVPGLNGTWFAVEPDPLDGSRAWVAGSTSGQVVHVDTTGALIQSLGGFSTSNKWLAVMLQGP